MVSEGQAGPTPEERVDWVPVGPLLKGPKGRSAPRGDCKARWEECGGGTHRAVSLASLRAELRSIAIDQRRFGVPPQADSVGPAPRAVLAFVHHDSVHGPKLRSAKAGRARPAGKVVRLTT